MVLLYMILGAIILYFVIKYSVRNAILEARIEELLEEIMSRKNEIVMFYDSKEMKNKATEINNESLKVSSSSRPVKEKLSLLKDYRNEIISIKK